MILASTGCSLGQVVIVLSAQGQKGCGMVSIRKARLADGKAAVSTLRQSITELCVADHGGDAGKLEHWLSNKTVDHWANWIARKDAVFLVAERGADVVGVGAATFGGEILLIYVHPGARLSGVSKALLAALEAEVRQHGARQCRLQSTITARPFYTALGYRPAPDGATYLKNLQT